jgi:spore coat protein CotH
MKKPIKFLVAAIVATSLAGCNGANESATGSQTGTQAAAAVDSSDSGLGAVGALDTGEVHTIDVSFGEASYGEMIEAYRATGDKEWIEATVTIDGTVYESAGIRLKGNSSLFGLSTASDPDTLPWLIKLDKYVEAQNHQGLTDLVVRSNNTTTALNEAVALELLELAGLASQDAITAAFSVNGGDPVLRLVIEHPDDVWMAEEFDATGALYKAESTGDYSYRGDDAESYNEVFDQEAGDDNADLSPLIDFLDFINNSDDSTFVAELAQWLDIDAFATYLAVQDLIGNFDDIDGPGNNSYLYYDTENGQFTVVAWDHNLAFGVSNGPGGEPGRRGDFGGLAEGEFPEDFAGNAPEGFRGPGGFEGAPPEGLPAPGEFEGTLPEGGFGERPGGPGGRGPGGGSNVLVERFLANDSWAELVESRTAELESEIVDSGIAADILDQWSEIIATSGLADDGTIESEAAQIQAVLAS